MHPIELTLAEQFAILMRAIETLNELLYTPEGIPSHRLTSINKSIDSLTKQAQEIAYSMALEKFADDEQAKENEKINSLRASLRKVG